MACHITKSHTPCAMHSNIPCSAPAAAGASRAVQLSQQCQELSRASIKQSLHAPLPRPAVAALLQLVPSVLGAAEVFSHELPLEVFMFHGVGWCAREGKERLIAQ